MGKIICEICGTVYPDTAECCPICGYSRDLGGFSDSPSYSDADYAGDLGLSSDEFDLGDTGAADDYGSQASGADPYQQNPYGGAPRQTPPQAQQGRRQIFDYDAVNPRERRSQGSYDSYQDVGNDVTLNDYPQDSYDNYDNYYNQGKPKSHVGLIIFLVILILLLMGASGFLLIKFILPNLNPTEPYVPETTVMITEAPTTVPTTEPTIPCETLALIEGGEVKLTREGQFYLVHASVSPENTTDKLTYASEDENVILVDEGGKITAVGEGTTNVVLTCGSQIIKLPVTVSYEEETEPTEGTGEAAEAAESGETEEGTETEETFDTVEDETEEAAAPEGEGSEETAETEEPTEPDVELKLKKTDLASGVRGVSFRLELDCPLDPKELEWSSTDLRVATVKDGVVTTVGPGTCQIVVKYGYQEVRCVIRCNF